MKTRLLIATAIASVLTFAATANASVETYQAHGVVKSINAETNTITLNQDGVDALGWPQRAMTYHIDGQNIAQGVQAGDKVDVTFDAASPYNATIHSIHKTNS